MREPRLCAGVSRAHGQSRVSRVGCKMSAYMLFAQGIDFGHTVTGMIGELVDTLMRALFESSTPQAVLHTVSSRVSERLTPALVAQRAVSQGKKVLWIVTGSEDAREARAMLALLVGCSSGKTLSSGDADVAVLTRWEAWERRLDADLSLADVVIMSSGETAGGLPGYLSWVPERFLLEGTPVLGVAYHHPEGASIDPYDMIVREPTWRFGDNPMGAAYGDVREAARALVRSGFRAPDEPASDEQVAPIVEAALFAQRFRVLSELKGYALRHGLHPVIVFEWFLTLFGAGHDEMPMTMSTYCHASEPRPSLRAWCDAQRAMTTEVVSA